MKLIFILVQVLILIKINRCDDIVVMKNQIKSLQSDVKAISQSLENKLIDLVKKLEDDMSEKFEVTNLQIMKLEKFIEEASQISDIQSIVHKYNELEKKQTDQFNELDEYIKELKTKTDGTPSKLITDLQLKIDKTNELNQNKIDELSKKLTESSLEAKKTNEKLQLSIEQSKILNQKIIGLESKFDGKVLNQANNTNELNNELESFKSNVKQPITKNYANGDKYVGELKNDLRNGKGIYYYIDGNRYEGEWRDDLRNGKGIFYYANGNKYDGEFKSDLFEGKGIMYYTNGNKYVGEFKNYLRNGKGIFYYANGNRYEGELKNDDFKKGVLYYTSGERYDGEWKDYAYNGKGIYYYNNGDRYDGGWKDGKKHGNYILYKPDGSYIIHK